MNKTNVFTTKYRDANKAHIPNIETYKAMYDQSIKNPDGFWAEQSKRLDWFEKWERISNNDFNNSEIKNKNPLTTEELLDFAFESLFLSKAKNKRLSEFEKRLQSSYLSQLNINIENQNNVSYNNRNTYSKY